MESAISLDRFPDDVREALNDSPVRLVIEYLLARLDLDDGNQWLRFRATNGALRQAEWERGPIGTQELEVLARRRVV